MDATNGPVVVGFDGRWRTRGMLQMAADEAQERGSALAVITVLRTANELDGGVDVLRADGVRARLQAREQLAEAATSARSGRGGLSVTTHCLTQEEIGPGREPLSSAALLVAGARLEYGRVALGLESVSRVLVAAARCPVLLVPEDPAAARQRRSGTGVVAGISEHPSDVEVARVAGAAAARRDGRLLLMHAYRKSPTEANGAAVRRACAVLARASEESGLPPKVQVSVLLTQDAAPAALTAQAAEGSLLVIGSRPGSLAGLVEDSVSGAVVAAAPCPVLVLPRALAEDRS